jgi:O-antigen/teichoic acid export membrane protein
MLGAQVLASFVVNDKYGIEAVGAYALVLAIAQIVVVGVGMPFSSLMRRDLALLGFKEAGNYTTVVNFFRIAITVLSIALASMLFPFFGSAMEHIRLFLLMVLLTKGLDMLNDTYFVAYQSVAKYRTYATLKISYAVLIWASLAVMYFGDFPIPIFYYTQVGIAAAFLLLNVYFFRRFRLQDLNRLEAPFHTHITKPRQLIKEAWPMVVNSLVSQGSAKLNAVIIFHFIGAGDLGIFSVLLMFSNIFAGVGNAIGIVVISNFTLLLQSSVVKFRLFFTKSLLVFFGIGLLMALLYSIALPILIQFYHFEHYNLFWLNVFIGSAIPFLFTTSCISNIFLILNKQIAGMYVAIVVLFVNVIAYVGLTHSLQLQGAGYAYFLMAFLQLALILWWTLRILSQKQSVAALPS